MNGGADATYFTVSSLDKRINKLKEQQFVQIKSTTF